MRLLSKSSKHSNRRTGLNCSRLLDDTNLDLGCCRVSLCLECLTNENANICTNLLAVEGWRSTCVNCSVELEGLIVDVHSSNIQWLLGSLRDESHILLNKVPSNAVGHGEDEVGEARDCLCSGCKLLNLDGVLAGNHLHRLLNNQTVCIVCNLHEA